MNLFLGLVNAAAAAAKATAQAHASQPTKKHAGGSSCTPCAAHAYVDKVRAQYAPPPATKRRK